MNSMTFTSGQTRLIDKLFRTQRHVLRSVLLFSGLQDRLPLVRGDPRLLAPSKSVLRTCLDFVCR